MDISLDLVMDAARRGLATLTPEVAGYVVLLATRQLEPRPFRVSAQTLLLGEGGDVSARPSEAASSGDVEATLRDVLARLIALSPSPAPAIAAVAERAVGVGLRELDAELAAALIPINHAAAQRALARLYRETQRAEWSTALAGISRAAPRAADEKASDARDEAAAPAGASRDLDIDVDVEAEAEAETAAEAEAETAAVELPPTLSRAAWAVPLELGERATETPPAAASIGSPGAARVEAPPAERVSVIPMPSIDLSASEPEVAVGTAIVERASLLDPPATGSVAALAVREPVDDTPSGGFGQMTWPSLPPEEEETGVEDFRSDVEQLLARFLWDPHAEEHLAQGLRCMLGLDPPVAVGATPRA